MTEFIETALINTNVPERNFPKQSSRSNGRGDFRDHFPQHVSYTLFERVETHAKTASGLDIEAAKRLRDWSAAQLAIDSQERA